MEKKLRVSVRYITIMRDGLPHLEACRGESQPFYEVEVQQDTVRDGSYLNRGEKSVIEGNGNK